jgi:hypothetical protein
MVDITPWMVTALLAAGGLFLLGLSSIIYVSFKFLSTILTLDISILRELQAQGNLVGESAKLAEQHTKLTAQVAQSAGPVLGERLRDFIAKRMAPTEGDFQPYSDEEMFIQEQVETLRRQGMFDDSSMTEKELDAFIRTELAKEKPSGNIANLG